MVDAETVAVMKHHIKYGWGLLVDSASLVAMAIAIGLIRLLTLIPPIKRFVKAKYEGPNFDQIEKLARDGEITQMDRGKAYVFKSIDFEVVSRTQCLSVSYPAVSKLSYLAMHHHIGFLFSFWTQFVV